MREGEPASISAPHSNVLRPLHLCSGAKGSAAGAGRRRQGRGDVVPPPETSLLPPQNCPWRAAGVPRVHEVGAGEVGQELGRQ